MPNSSDFNRFSVNPVNIDISRSLFNMNHSVKFSCNVGEVIPFDVIEVLPGDTFSIDTSKVIRLQPLVAPIMDEVILDTYWFFVPNRLVWSHWKEFMGENNESAWTPETSYGIPQITPPASPAPYESTNMFEIGTIADYMGLPAGQHLNSFATFNALPFRAYALICSEWFRSESIMDPVHVFTDDVSRIGSNGSDQVSDIELGGKPFIACKFFDYFTSCLPGPQRSNTGVSFPLLDDNGRSISLPVTTENFGSLKHPYEVGLSTTNDGVTLSHKTPGSDLLGFSSNASLDVDNTNHLRFGTAPASEQANQTVYFSNLFAQLRPGYVNSVSVNDLRTAFAMQKYLEKQARFGGRYTEFIKGFFNIDSPDARLQRSEYLGGSRMSLNINSVEQTSATQVDSTPLGDVAGMSVTADQNSDFTKSFTEHGFIIGCSVVRYHHSYQQMTHRMWLHDTEYSFYNPVMANLGEQAVYTRELFTPQSASSPSALKRMTFGYQERWSEYRYLPNKICGQMRSTYSQPLDMWHLGDYYSDRPYLSPEWLREDKSNLDRCLAVTSDVSNQVICDFYVETEASRAMPLYSIPGLIDHH